MSEITVCLIIAVVTMILFHWSDISHGFDIRIVCFGDGNLSTSVKLSAIYSGFGTAQCT